jgi:uncharacterized lipoprotein
MKRWCAVVLIVSMAACAMQDIKTMPTQVVNTDFDKTWTACLRAIDDVGFIVITSDKEGGIITAKKAGKFMLQNADMLLTVYVTKSETGEIKVDAKSVQQQQIGDVYGINKKTIADFEAALKKRLG